MKGVEKKQRDLAGIRYYGSHGLDRLTSVLCVVHDWLFLSIRMEMV